MDDKILASILFGIASTLEEAAERLRRPKSNSADTEAAPVPEPESCLDAASTEPPPVEAVPEDNTIEFGREPEATAVAGVLKDTCLRLASADCGVRAEQLFKETGADKACVKKTLRELTTAGLLRTEGVKRGCRYFAVQS